jgi:hypothetical protein
MLGLGLVISFQGVLVPDLSLSSTGCRMVAWTIYLVAGALVVLVFLALQRAGLRCNSRRSSSLGHRSICLHTCCAGAHFTAIVSVPWVPPLGMNLPSRC